MTAFSGMRVDPGRRALGLALALALSGASAAAQVPGAGEGRLIDQNGVIAVVNGEIITLHDVLLEWRLDGRAKGTAGRPAAPPAEVELDLAKEIVKGRLWLARAKEWPGYADIVTPRYLDEELKRRFGPILDDPTLAADERALLRRKTEQRLAEQLVLSSDPQFQRMLNARPRELRRQYQANPQLQHVPTTARLGMVALGKQVHANAAELALSIRQRATDLGSLEAAAKELAPGSYSEQGPVDLEKNTDLRDEVLQFARSAGAGEVSAPVEGGSSVLLFTLLQRDEGRDRPFSEVAPALKEMIEGNRAAARAEQYFVVEILREATYGPPSLFAREVEKFFGRR